MGKTIFITNATGTDMELRWHHNKIQQSLEIPRYGLNIEYTFEDDQEMDKFFSLYGVLEETGELVFGKTSENKAVDANGEFEEKDKAEKQKKTNDITQNFENSVNSTLGSEASIKLTSQKGKKDK